jgi:hypothetical protein
MYRPGPISGAPLDAGVPATGVPETVKSLKARSDDRFSVAVSWSASRAS